MVLERLAKPSAVQTASRFESESFRQVYLCVMSARSDGPPWKWEVASSNLATQTSLCLRSSVVEQRLDKALAASSILAGGTSYPCVRQLSRDLLIVGNVTFDGDHKGQVIP